MPAGVSLSCQAVPARGWASPLPGASGRSSPGQGKECPAPGLTDGCSAHRCLHRRIREFLLGLLPGMWRSFTHTEIQESLLGLEGK
ncbi:hypothetical protein DV515_00014426 [Chloebia gouldiae]|uniref:Uncharacterized protein n=1 Tax=Chloebia gouldiae TaxID=44316 RepID=A0A3L8RZD5_CHLGU|nr:hypothetical protein DV515_00014426 [Chloebia gouldiae]